MLIMKNLGTEYFKRYGQGCGQAGADIIAVTRKPLPADFSPMPRILATLDI